MAKLLTVVGATGTQGQSVIDAALKEGKYAIRGIGRDISSEKAKLLASKGVEMVEANLNDEQSLIKAFEGSSAIYAVTDFFEPFAALGPDEAMKVEAAQGFNLANAAMQTATLEHYIWSTLPNATKVSRGHTLIPHFEAKNRVDRYIKRNQNLLEKTTFLWITWYANNYQYPVFTPNYLNTSGSYVQLSTSPPDTPIRTIGSPRANIGKFVMAILSQPLKTLPGKFVLGSVEETTTGDLLKTWGEVTGKKTTYVQTSLEDFSEVWPMWGMEMGAMMKVWGEAREDSWSGEELLTKEELGLGGEKFVGVRGTYEGMDWSKLI